MLSLSISVANSTGPVCGTSITGFSPFVSLPSGSTWSAYLSWLRHREQSNTWEGHHETLERNSPANLGLGLIYATPRAPQKKKNRKSPKCTLGILGNAYERGQHDSIPTVCSYHSRYSAKSHTSAGMRRTVPNSGLG